MDSLIRRIQRRVFAECIADTIGDELSVGIIVSNGTVVELRPRFRIAGIGIHKGVAGHTVNGDAAFAQMQRDAFLSILLDVPHCLLQQWFPKFHTTHSIDVAAQFCLESMASDPLVFHRLRRDGHQAQCHRTSQP